MSSQQTVRITTTETSNTSALILNIGYLATPPGILKVLQVILGCICVGIISYNFNEHGATTKHELFFFMMCTTFLICSAILLLSCLVSWSTGGIICKTIYELLYHVVAAILILIASIALIVIVTDKKSQIYYHTDYKPLLTAGVLGILNALLYFVSTFYARRSYKGI